MRRLRSHPATTLRAKDKDASKAIIIVAGHTGTSKGRHPGVRTLQSVPVFRKRRCPCCDAFPWNINRSSISLAHMIIISLIASAAPLVGGSSASLPNASYLTTATSTTTTAPLEELFLRNGAWPSSVKDSAVVPTRTVDMQTSTAATVKLYTLNKATETATATTRLYKDIEPPRPTPPKLPFQPIPKPFTPATSTTTIFPRFRFLGGGDDDDAAQDQDDAAENDDAVYNDDAAARAVDDDNANNNNNNNNNYQEEGDQNNNENGNNDDGNQKQDDDHAADDNVNDDDGNNQNNNNNHNNNNGIGEDDDFFDDGIQDDLVNYAADDAYQEQEVDDFYAYAEDPGPPRLFPLDTREVVGYLVAAMALTLGASGGIGGGGIIVPVYVLIVGLPIKAAIPIGAATVLGGSMGSTLLNLPRRHPLADRPIIDWDLILVMEPLTLCGTLLGTLFHRMLSEKLLVVILVFLLSITAHTTLTKAMRMHRAERRYIRHLKAAQAEPPSGTSQRTFNFGVVGSMDEHDTTTQNILKKSTADTNIEKHINMVKRQHERAMNKAKKMNGSNNNSSNKEDAQDDISLEHRIDMEEKEQILIENPDFVTLRSDLIEEEKFTPRSKVSALVALFTIIIFLNIMCGGGAFQSPWDIGCGSTAFWTIHVIMTAVLVASAWAAQTYVVARHEIKEIVRFDYVHGDIKWNGKSAIVYPAVFILAGLSTGTLGIGGGVITVPLMLSMGVHPAVVSSTSSAMILFTSVASVSSFLVFGLILPDYAGVGMALGFCSAIVGQNVMRYARVAKSASGRTFERNSYTAFVIGGIVLFSALLMTLQYVFLIVDETIDDGGLCDGLRF